MTSAKMRSGSAKPIDSFAPKTSAKINTEIIDAPEKPDLEIPTENAANAKRAHELGSRERREGM